MTNYKYVVLPDSKLPDIGTLGGPADPSEEIEISVYVRSQGEKNDIPAVEKVASELGLNIVSKNPDAHRIVLKGTIATIGKFVGVEIQKVKSHFESHTRAVGGELRVPEELGGIVQAIFGIDNRPIAKPRSIIASNPKEIDYTYTPVDLAQIYGFPQASGKGQTVSIIELGGGFKESDLDTYFNALGVGRPAVKAVSVDGARNSPGDGSGADGEVLLDIEVVGGIAPDSSILVYFAPNTDRGFIDAVADAVHAKPTPAAVSISWGNSENVWSTLGLRTFNSVIQEGAELGVAVAVAAGDNGSSDGQYTDRHVDFPSSSPYALACGGTRLYAKDGKVESETVWNDNSNSSATGGGVSSTFDLPSYQEKVAVPPSPRGGKGRGVPDVAGVADPQTGYEVLIDGKPEIIGGTSAVAPLWSGLIARLAELKGGLIVNLHEKLYKGATQTHTSPLFRDIVEGNNGAYSAKPGWDAATGLGVPTKEIAALAK